MRTKLALAALAATVAASATPAIASTASATANATAKGVVLVPLTLTKSSDLDFGTVVASATAGQVTISPDDGSRSVTGGVTGVPSLPGGRAVFQGAGTGGTSVVLSLHPVTLLSNGSTTINVSKMTFDTGASSTVSATGPTAGYLTTTRTTDPTSGAFLVGVGATFDIAANQANGVYSGTFSVTADYQ